MLPWTLSSKNAGRIHKGLGGDGVYPSTSNRNPVVGSKQHIFVVHHPLATPQPLSESNTDFETGPLLLTATSSLGQRVGNRLITPDAV